MILLFYYGKEFSIDKEKLDRLYEKYMTTDMKQNSI